MSIKDKIKLWLCAASLQEFDYLLIVCDTFDYEYYPVGCYAADFWTHWPKYQNDMKRVMEVYNLNMDLISQFDEGRAWHLPPHDGTTVFGRDSHGVKA